MIIQEEYYKLGIHLDKKAIRNILTDFNLKGEVKQSLTWKQFLNLQIHIRYMQWIFLP